MPGKWLLIPGNLPGLGSSPLFDVHRPREAQEKSAALLNSAISPSEISPSDLSLISSLREEKLLSVMAALVHLKSLFQPCQFHDLCCHIPPKTPLKAETEAGGAVLDICPPQKLRAERSQ